MREDGRASDALNSEQSLVEDSDAARSTAGADGSDPYNDAAVPNGLGRTTTVLTVVGGLALIVMTLHVLVDVTARFFFNHAFITTIDYIRYWWMPAFGFVGVAAAQMTGEHVSIRILEEGVSPPHARLVRCFGSLMTALFYAGVMYYAGQQAIEHMERRQYAGTSGLPTWQPELILPVSMGVGCLCALLQAVGHFPGRKKNAFV
jgi:TRAP-type C4-dicarboxylate transport system, small permease component